MLIKISQFMQVIIQHSVVFQKYNVALFGQSIGIMTFDLFKSLTVMSKADNKHDLSVYNTIYYINLNNTNDVFLY